MELNSVMKAVQKAYSIDHLQNLSAPKTFDRNRLKEQFEELIKNTNSILFYLSNLEF